MERCVLLYLADAENGRTRLCCPSQGDIAEHVETSTRTVRSALSALEAGGYIRRQPRQRSGGRGRTSDAYELAYDQPEARFHVNGDDQPEDTSDRSQRPTGSTATTNRKQASRASLQENRKEPIEVLRTSTTKRKDTLPEDPKPEQPTGEQEPEPRGTTEILEEEPGRLVARTEGHALGPGGEALLRRVERRLSEGSRSWNLANLGAKLYDELAPNLKIRFLADYCRLAGLEEDPNFARLGLLAKRHGKLALLGLDEGLSRGRTGDELYRYAEAVAKEAAARLRESEQEAAE
jgi:hypothetical protein